MQKGEDYILKTYNRYPVVFEKGDGVSLYDMDGKRYLDFAAGIAVFALGYNNKEYNDALKNQIDKILYRKGYWYRYFKRTSFLGTVLSEFFSTHFCGQFSTSFT